jgi:hypothetical protein
VRLTATYSAGTAEFYQEDYIQVLGGTGHFVRGDANNDGDHNISDPIKILGYLFSSDTIACLDAADSNDDGELNIADPIFLLGYLFSGGENPPPPFPTAGADPTPDGLDCNL